jgi:hypothetical protein
MGSRIRSPKIPGIFLVVGMVFSMTAGAGERGAVTAIASLSSQVSAFIGFSSGTVLYCTRKGGCTELEHTPRSAVTTIDTPREGDSIRAWVGYEDGSILFCTLTGGCVVQEQ